MTITIELTPGLEAELARQAAIYGVAINAYAAVLLEDAAQRPVPFVRGRDKAQDAAEVMEAIEQLKSFGRTQGLSLGGITIRELRHEARP